MFTLVEEISLPFLSNSLLVISGCFSEVCAVLLLRLGQCFLRVTLESDELAHKVLIYIHYGGVIVKISTIVLRTEDCDELLILAKEAVAIFHNLMPTAYQVEIVVR